MTTIARRPVARRAIAATLGLLVLAACSSAVPASRGPAVPTPGSTPVMDIPTPPAESAPADGPVTIDAALLAILPVAIDSILVIRSPEGETALFDPEVATVASRGASAIAVDQASGDLVYALVLALRSGAFDEARYRQWRDSYDEGACSQAGGVIGHAEVEIGGRRTFIGTCGGGLHTYHVWLTEPGLLVSASALGEGRFGEALIAGLRP